MSEIPVMRSWSDMLPLQHQSLIVLDIDETFLWFPTINEVWWSELLRSLRTQHDAATTHILAKKEWERVVAEESPVQTDTEGFRILNKEIRESKSKLIFLTARMESIAPLTRKHLRDCGVSADVEVHYSVYKGEALRRIVSRNPQSKNVVFVDDKISNLRDVKQYNPTVNVYQWKIKQKNL
jgi:hypothetical protein